jgi:hypothetical protein
MQAQQRSDRGKGRLFIMSGDSPALHARNIQPQRASQDPSPRRPTWLKWLLRFFFWGFGIAAAGALSVLCVVAVALAVAYPNLPDISDLSDYRPKLPLRVFSAEGMVIGEFGEERRNLTPIKAIPKVMKDAVLAIEDTRFYDHGGVDYKGMVRAGLANMNRVKSQGASTITMQVARNVYLSSEKTLHPQDLRGAADLQAGAPAEQGPDLRDLYEPDLPGQPRLRLCRRLRGVLRQAAAGTHDRAGRHAGRPAQGARARTTPSTTRSARAAASST